MAGTFNQALNEAVRTLTIERTEALQLEEEQRGQALLARRRSRQEKFGTLLQRNFPSVAFELVDNVHDPDVPMAVAIIGTFRELKVWRFLGRLHFDLIDHEEIIDVIYEIECPRYATETRVAAELAKAILEGPAPHYDSWRFKGPRPCDRDDGDDLEL
jgi:hypothetical protein